ncbi:concanavalin A-like lectin/glucanase superfamily protein [Micromonospora sp. Llam0]|nr:concanavalin A-like lectin/glucanase superfamily protein [Micromonospora sp. Llam0]
MQLDGDPSDPLPTENAAAVAQGGAQVEAFVLGYDAGDQQWGFWMRGSDAADSPALALATSPVTPVPGEWVHLVGVYDAGTSAISLYVNGQTTGPVQLSAPMTWSATGALTLARERWNGALSNFFPGSIDQVSVYAGSVSAREVGNLYGATS